MVQFKNEPMNAGLIDLRPAEQSDKCLTGIAIQQSLITSIAVLFSN
jgi:hypothetical protein